MLGIYADATYYTVNDTGKITYTAANVTSLSLNEPKPALEQFASYSCDPGKSTGLNELQRVGSCAFTNIQAVNTGTITLTGENTSVDGYPGSGLSMKAVTSVTVGSGPKISGVTNPETNQQCNVEVNPGCVITARQREVISIWGAGFDPTGGNTVELASSSPSLWLYEANGYYFWDRARGQINAEIGCYVAPGIYTLKVWSPNSGTPSNGATISVTAGGDCP